MNYRKNKIYSFLTGFLSAAVIFAAFLAGFSALAAWVEPTQAPPFGNIDSPLNTGPVKQTKIGGLTIGTVVTTTKLCFGAIGNDCKSTWEDVLGVWQEGPDGIYYSAGNVGIGAAITGFPPPITWPLNFAELAINADNKEGLYISRNSAAPYSYLNIENESSNPVFKVHESGNVGIGTVSPGFGLDISNSTNATLRVYNQTPITGSTKVVFRNGIAQSGNIFETQSSGGGVGVSIANFGSVTFPRLLYIQANTAWANIADVRFRIDSQSGQTGDLIRVNSFSGTLGDLFVIKPTGNVGIGTTNPGAKLEVNGQSMFGSAAQVIGSGQNLIYGNINSASLGSLLLLQNNTIDKFRIDKDGNVKSATLSGVGDRCVQADSTGTLKAVSCTAVGGGLGQYRGVTTLIFNGSQGGYTGANDKCEAAFPAISGIHVCTSEEIFYNIRLGVAMPAGTQAWINNGAPEVAQSANDCEGWSTASNGSVASVWEFGATGGKTLLKSCNYTKVFACCQ